MRLAHSFRTLSLIAASAFLLPSCASRHDVEVQWTVDGQPANAALCAAAGDALEVVVLNFDVEGEEPVEVVTEGACADGFLKIAAGNNATIRVRLTRSGTETGTSSAATAPYATTDGNLPVVNANIAVHTGSLGANLLVANESCGDAGASSFHITLRRNLVGLDTEIVEEADVSCTDGNAFYENASVVLGRRYFIDATTTIGGKNYSADVQGHIGVAVETDQVHTVIDVSLSDNERQSFTPDAGPDDLIDVPNPPRNDAGTPLVDAGTTTDAGATPTDAGAATTDAGAATTDAGVSDAG
ncbi:MAG: hypothetical protein GY822_18365 [Deltaproteobacteria bacterium]|nr:hypothetical protein [Deltaproteobacteria bacterium]